MKKIVEKILPILDTLRNEHCLPILVGGCVRDFLMGKEVSKDVDVEVYGTDYDRLSEKLSHFGKVDLVGKSFGVIKLKYKNEYYDFSIPRKEEKSASGHKGFDVSFEDVSMYDAFSRRDFTMNAIGYDYSTDKYLDLFGGVEDIKKKVIRHTSSDKFVEDPLRILRAMQFQCRFGFEVAEETYELMREMNKTDCYKQLSIERIGEEFRKWCWKGKYHYKIFEFMRNSGMCKYFPEFDMYNEETFSIIESPSHTAVIISMKRMSEYISEYIKNDDVKELFVYSSMFILTDYNNVRGLMERMGVYNNIINKVVKLLMYKNEFEKFEDLTTTYEKNKFVYELYNEMLPLRLYEYFVFVKVIYFNNDISKHIYIGDFILTTMVLKIGFGEKFNNIITGDDLISIGLTPSTKFKEILADCVDAQLNHKFTNKEEALVWLQSYIVK